MGTLKYLTKTNESTKVYLSTPKGLTIYTVTTTLTYKTPDNYYGYIVKAKEQGDI
jgi:hypothetical protein